MGLKKRDQFLSKNNNWKKVIWLKIIQSNKILNLSKIMETHTDKGPTIRWSTTQTNTLQLLGQGNDRYKDLLTIIEAKSISRQMILKTLGLRNGKNQRLLAFLLKIIKIIYYKTATISHLWRKCLHRIISNQADQDKIITVEINIFRLRIATEESTPKIQSK